MSPSGSPVLSGYLWVPITGLHWPYSLSTCSCLSFCLTFLTVVESGYLSTHSLLTLVTCQQLSQIFPLFLHTLISHKRITNQGEILLFLWQFPLMNYFPHCNFFLACQTLATSVMHGGILGKDYFFWLAKWDYIYSFLC